MRTRETDVEPFVNLSELTEIELLILRRMREFTIGEHRSVFHGSGFDLVGLREWQPGDRMSQIDWPQSTMTNFSPMIVRNFEQRSTATVITVADASLSTRCGIDGIPIAAAIARAIGTIGMSAVFFQDMFGLITFDARFDQLAAVRPHIGKNQVIHCLDAYQFQTGLQPLKRSESLSMSLAGFMRKTSMVPVISDFLFDNPGEVLRELAHLNSTHDVFIVLIDSAFAFELPPISAGWVEAFDVETGRARVMSRGAMSALSRRTRAWQDDVARLAKDNDLDVLRIGVDERETAIALSEFIAERRLRKV
ncbi:MAG: hypothetical protein DMG04_11430 [Acidobacteria bacterium]|nr:MAG: hypothetical protein DMG04_11430 [Acidobacteriota bacterium]PYQ83579.1 MAG: hypothetical protein DMG03_13135 [Acidobacteriota bacterium]PYQ87940.1 MAG: hypothetical protein DMG02_20080 [Acidobacteriota bacterium]